ncbi:MAG: hypothetical protein KY457_08170 [Actinobacteria bacterium]|nr:hypothetical protein [Actinomycetota bacterium]
MSRWRVAWRLGGVLVVATALVASGVGLALRLPATSVLPPLPEAGAVGLSRIVTSELPPLAAGFVARVLGGRLPATQVSATELVGQDGAGPVLTAAPPDALRRLPPARSEVRHGDLAHDVRAEAYEVPGVPFTARSTTHGADREPEEPVSCSPTGGTVWYRYTATRDAVLAASTFGSDHATALAVFPEDGDGRPSSMAACDLDASGNAEVVVTASHGRTYLFQVTSPAGGGRLVFHLDEVGTTRRVSLRADGGETDANSSGVAISADGRTIAFRSDAALVPEDRQDRGATYNGDIYVADLTAGTIELVSVSSAGEPADHFSDTPAISGDGRFVAFTSPASNLVPGDTNGYEDVFVHDRTTRRTVRASVATSGAEGWLPLTGTPREAAVGHWHLQQPSVTVSGDGRFVAFSSDLAGLVLGDDRGCVAAGGHDGSSVHAIREMTVPDHTAPASRCRDIFVRDLHTRTTTRVSVSSDGAPGDGDSSSAFITPDGRYVAFASGSTNLVADDDNGYRDVFLHDRDVDGDGRFDEEGAIATSLESRNRAGGPAGGSSGGTSHRGHVTVSADGRYIAFMSDAPDLVERDVNVETDVFLRDRATGTTLLVSAPRRLEGDDRHLVVDGNAHHSVISADGRYVAFSADTASRPGGEGRRDVLVYDRLGHVIRRVSVGADGSDANGNSYEPDLSADGYTVAFSSLASNLVEDDRNVCRGPVESATPSGPGCQDVFVHRVARDRS